MRAEDLIKIAVAVLVLCTIIGLVFGFYRYGKSIHQTTIVQEDDSYDKLRSELDWTRYVGRIVTGSDVKNLITGEISKYRIELLNGKFIGNGKSTEEVKSIEEVSSSVNDSSSKYYIDPVAKFSVTIKDGIVVFKEVVI